MSKYDEKYDLCDECNSTIDFSCCISCCRHLGKHHDDYQCEECNLPFCDSPLCQKYHKDRYHPSVCDHCKESISCVKVKQCYWPGCKSKIHSKCRIEHDSQIHNFSMERIQQIEKRLDFIEENMLKLCS